MKKLILCILPLLLLSSAALGQSTNAGDIRGTVTDTSGALIPGVTVKVLNVNTGVEETLVTNDAGLYDTNSILYLKTRRFDLVPLAGVLRELVDLTAAFVL